MAKRRQSSTKRSTRRRSSTKKVRGFSENAERIAKRKGISLKRARAILAAATRRASPAAKRRNPRLKRVKGKPKRKTTRRRR